MSWRECDLPNMGTRREPKPIAYLAQNGSGWLVRINQDAAKLASIAKGDFVKIEYSGDLYRIRKTLEGEKGAHGRMIHSGSHDIGFSAAGAVLSRKGFGKGRMEVKTIYAGAIVFDPTPVKIPPPEIDLSEIGGRKRVWREAVK